MITAKIIAYATGKDEKAALDNLIKGVNAKKLKMKVEMSYDDEEITKLSHK